MGEDEYWQAILNRDRRYDGIFFSVRSLIFEGREELMP
jgi:methylphosphotriester-DNA--protein-cysteine methyltransferase